MRSHRRLATALATVAVAIAAQASAIGHEFRWEDPDNTPGVVEGWRVVVDGQPTTVSAALGPDGVWRSEHVPIDYAVVHTVTVRAVVGPLESVDSNAIAVPSCAHWSGPDGVFGIWDLIWWRVQVIAGNATLVEYRARPEHGTRC